MRIYYSILAFDDKAVRWWMKLTVLEKINIKRCFYLICGVRWEELSRLLSMRERIELAWMKLKKEKLI